MSPEADLTAPVVMVTGATGPLGRAAAHRFARDGARICLVGRNRETLEELGDGLDLERAEWMTVAGELTEQSVAHDAVAQVEQRWGRLDVLLHLVGGWVGGTPVVDLDHAELRRMLDQHLWTTLYATQAVVPGMVERGYGRIVVISSPFATTPGPRGASYAIGKAAEEVVIRSLARELSSSGVTANVLIVRTIDEKHERESQPSAKNASWATAEEIADTLAFIASPAAGAINGARIPLDGR